MRQEIKNRKKEFEPRRMKGKESRKKEEETRESKTQDAQGRSK